MTIGFKFPQENWGEKLPEQNPPWHIIVSLKQPHIMKLEVDVDNALTNQTFYNGLQESQ